MLWPAHLSLADGPSSRPPWAQAQLTPEALSRDQGAGTASRELHQDTPLGSQVAEGPACPLPSYLRRLRPTSAPSSREHGHHACQVRGHASVLISRLPSRAPCPPPLILPQFLCRHTHMFLSCILVGAGSPSSVLSPGSPPLLLASRTESSPDSASSWLDDPWP